MTTEETNTVIARRFYEELWNQGNVAVAEELVAVDHVDNNPPIPESATGREGAVELMLTFKQGFPDFHITIDEIITSSDRAVERFTFRGTHQGEFMGIAPTGKSVEISSVSVCRIADGKVAERWGASNGIGMLTQLGLLPEPGSTAWYRLIRLANTRVRTSRALSRSWPALAAGGLAAGALVLLRKRR